MSKVLNMSLVKIFLLAFLIRLFLAFLVWHPDVNNHIDWGIRFWEYGPSQFYKANVWSFTWPNQPPGSIYIYAFMRKAFEATFAFFWWLNITIPPFPSGIITYFESNLYTVFLKLPSILADIGISYLVYKFVLSCEELKRKEFLAKLASVLFLVNPAIWYNSSLWGQNDSVINFFAFLAFYMLVKKRLTLAEISFALSIYIKASLLIFAPIFIVVAVRQKYDLSSWVKSVLIALVIFGLFTLPFSRSEPFGWLYEIYKDKVFKQQLHIITANAFNIWAGISGIHEKPDSLFLGPFKYQTWGLFLFYLSYIPSLYAVFKKQTVKNIMWALMIASFSSFMLLTNMHERYLYPLFAPLSVIAVLESGFLSLYLVISGIHLVNLYNFWWYPKVEAFIDFMSWRDRLMPRILGFVNFGIFVYIYLRFLRLLKSVKV